MSFEPRSSSLSQIQIKEIVDNLSEKETLVCAGVAKIHTKQKNEFNFSYTGLFGAICYIIDRRSSKKFIKMVDLNSFEVIYEMEVLSPLINAYQKMNDNFYYFYYKNSIVGYSFAESDDATSISNAINFYTMNKSINPHLFGKFNYKNLKSLNLLITF